MKRTNINLCCKALVLLHSYCCPVAIVLQQQGADKPVVGHLPNKLLVDTLWLLNLLPSNTYQYGIPTCSLSLIGDQIEC